MSDLSDSEDVKNSTVDSSKSSSPVDNTRGDPDYNLSDESEELSESENVLAL